MTIAITPAVLRSSRPGASTCPLAVGDTVRLSKPEWPRATRAGQSGVVEAIEDDAENPPLNPSRGREPVLVTVAYHDGRGFHLPRELEVIEARACDREPASARPATFDVEMGPENPEG